MSVNRHQTIYVLQEVNGMNDLPYMAIKLVAVISHLDLLIYWFKNDKTLTEVIDQRPFCYSLKLFG